MANYRYTQTDIIVRTSDGTTFGPGHRFYDEYLAWEAAGGVPDPYAAPPDPVPQSISDRQFFQQLALQGIITQTEALESNAAVIPPALLAIINTMAAEQQFAAKMLVSGATIFERNHPMTIAIGTAYGWAPDEIDKFFVAASSL